MLQYKFRAPLYDGFEIMKPGYTRFNLSYFATAEEIDYVLGAIEFVCKFGWMFLPCYTTNFGLSLWDHYNDNMKAPKLQEIDYGLGEMHFKGRNGLFDLLPKESSMDPLQNYLE
jgi:hypothetical protein